MLPYESMLEHILKSFLAAEAEAQTVFSRASAAVPSAANTVIEAAMAAVASASFMFFIFDFSFGGDEI
jgi:hypothetical protein